MYVITNYIVLVNETKSNSMLETSEMNFNISRTNAVCLICNFSPETQDMASSVMIEYVEVSKCKTFCQLGFIIQKSMELMKM